MLVATEELAFHSGEVAMVDGGFDPIHAGHVEYFRAAAELGAPVLCNVSSDAWVARKHPPFLAQEERAAIIDAFRDVSFTHVSKTSTEEVLRLLRPRYYVKGSDWRGRLPEEQLEICAEGGVEIVYLDTVTNSSTEILLEYERRLRASSDG
jgi:D-beta-D-heptose 7-phosphate kinase/D-beta-D-heptose 1-phosphate adenosyltransferase